MPAPGENFEDLFNKFQEMCKRRGITHEIFVQVPPDYINPYALGHIINHPPPNTAANCQLIDFDLPYSFFPTTFARYIPYIDFRAEQKSRGGTETRNRDVFRAVAVVATETVGHGEELYLDYF